MWVTLLQNKGMNHCYGIYSLFPGQSEQLLLCTDWWQAPLCFSLLRTSISVSGAGEELRWNGKTKLLGKSSGSESPQDRVAPSGQCPTWHWCTVSILAAEGIQMVQKREDEMEWVREEGGRMVCNESKWKALTLLIILFFTFIHIWLRERCTMGKFNKETIRN